MKRKINGILLLDKPRGISSNEALQIVKRCYHAQKAGHTGSLDPLATGMLPLCFGEGTKFSQFLLESDKRYFVTGKLGVTTASADSEGEVIAEKSIAGITTETIQQVLPKFRGKISQIPSMFSALKHKGEPLYKLARQGIEVAREPREINIYALNFVSFEADLLSLEVHCSKGTYVRTLIADIGDALGCGAHVVTLRRLSVGPFEEQRMVKLGDVQELAAASKMQELDQLLLPLDSIFDGWNEVKLSNDMVFYVQQGNPVIVPKAPTSGMVKLVTKDGVFIGVGEILPDGRVAPRRLVAR